MQRAIWGCLAIVIGLAGCKSASNSSADSDIPTKWFGNSVPNQSEPEMSESEPPDQKTGTRTASGVEKAGSTSGTSGNLLTRWFQGGGEKSSLPKRIPLPLSDSEPHGDSPSDTDDDF